MTSAAFDVLGIGNAIVDVLVQADDDQLDRFAEFWPKIRAHVLAVNLNGMIAGGDKVGKKIHPLGEGDRS